MLRAALLTFALMCTAACGSAGQPVPYDATGIDGLEIPTTSPDPADFVAVVDNPWLPLARRDEWRYAVEDDGVEVGSMRVAVTGATDISGLRATEVTTTTRVRGEGRDQATSYYAQDVSGNVWLVGEDRGDVSWRAGADHAAGLAMPAAPRLGDAWVRADSAPTTETVRVVEDGVGDDPDQVTLESVETGRRTTFAAGTGPVTVTYPQRGWIVDLVD